MQLLVIWDLLEGHAQLSWPWKKFFKLLEPDPGPDPRPDLKPGSLTLSLSLKSVKGLRLQISA